MTTASLTIRLENFRLTNESNKGGHWAGGKSKRAKSQRASAQLHVMAELNERSNKRLPPLRMPVTVTMTRIAPRPFDYDGLTRSFKAIRDGIADALLPHNRGNATQTWADDSDGQIIWVYDQQRGLPKQHAVVITIHEVISSAPERTDL